MLLKTFGDFLVSSSIFGDKKGRKGPDLVVNLEVAKPVQKILNYIRKPSLTILE